jgi:hypothetical protein
VAAGAYVSGYAGPPSSGYLEYDAAARITLEIGRRFEANDWTIVAPQIQRLKVARQRYLGLADFVRKYERQAGDRAFRFDHGTRHLFVFVEKKPLIGGTRGPAAEGSRPADYQMPNARVRLERAALDLCERYSRTHAGASVYYEDDDLRVYHFENER